MAKLRDIKNRIHAVSKTRKITRTMEMVATSKMKKWQNVVLSSRPYAQALSEVLRQLGTAPEALAHPLMQPREKLRRAAILTLTSNRGLCGAFNINIARKARLQSAEYRNQDAEVDLYAVGKKGITFFNHHGLPLVYKNTTIMDIFSAEETRQLTNLLCEAYLSGRVDRVEAIYSRYISVGRQEVVSEQLLPLSVPAGPERESMETDFLFEPSPEQIVNTLLPLFAQSTVYRMLAENIASEQAARRKAMKQATDNADDMITFLTRRYNRERQTQITKELSEIVGGSDAIA